MDSIRTALGTLQAEPDSEDGWVALKEAVEASNSELSESELSHLLDVARSRHAERGEWEAVARLLGIESEFLKEEPRRVELLSERARVLAEQLFDEQNARVTFEQVLSLEPDNSAARAALAESDDKKARVAELTQEYLAEAEKAPDEVYKSSMLMRSAEMDVRYGGEESDLKPAIERLEQAVRLDPTNERAGRLLEGIYRRSERWEEAARVLERLSDRSESPYTRVGSGVRLARLYAQHLSDQERAARAYHRVLRDAHEHPEAKAFLSEFYSENERWEELVSLYEADIKPEDRSRTERIGDMLQVAMLYWRKLGRPDQAEPWFERIRRLDGAHEGMLSFCREYYRELDDDTRLIDVLSGAQRAVGKGKKQTALANEIAKLAEGQENAAKAIEQYKSVLRQEPDNTEARDALKRIYKQTQGYNALVELLRQQLERTPAEDYAGKLAVLREVATVYRQYIKSETALVSVLNQIVQLDDKLDEHDVAEVRELVALYEKLERWRDLLTHQLKLAEITPDIEEKKSLYRSAARRWLDQFSNAQNATEAYEALLKVAPDDIEARERLEELYRKRRAWPALYELFKSELDEAEGEKRLSLMKEMAQLAADRLNRGDEAVKLYKRIMASDPARSDVLDALERHAERARDWVTLADALELRVGLTDDDAVRLNVLSKLGSVCAEHLDDPARAADAWRRVLELSPGHPRALRVLRESYLQGGDYDGLEELYASQSDWEGLADVLSNAADRAKDNQGKIELSYRAAAVYEQKLGQSDRAFRSYERILSADPMDARAARSLVPLYEQDEKWARLPALYEVLFQRSESDQEKLAQLFKLVDVTGKRLNDRQAALSYARRAYELAPEVERSLTTLEGAARAAGDFVPFVESLEARLASLADAPSEAQEEADRSNRRKGRRKKRGAAEPEAAKAPESAAARRALELMLADIYSSELGKTSEAIGVYRRLVERDPTDVAAYEALEKLLRRENRTDDLRWLFEVRVTHSVSDSDRVAILLQWAELEQDVFGSPEQAARLYARVLSIEPSDATSLKALPVLLLSSGDVQAAAEVMQRHRDLLEGAARAEREADLAELYASKLERPNDAIEAAVRAMEEPGQKARAVAILEKMLEVPSVRARAAEVLASQYSDAGEARREAQALNVMLGQAKNPSERARLYLRLSDVFEKKLAEHGSALDVLLRAVAEFPSELSYWDRADSLAMHAGRPTDLAEAFREALRGDLPAELEVELCERAARLHEDRLGDPMGATPYLEKVLAIDPSTESAFGRLKDILTAAERWNELETLYDRASKATDDTGRRIEMLVEVALICEEIIEDASKATRYYERIFEADPLHEATLSALDRLYTRQDKFEDLARLLEHRLETATGEEAVELKLRLAKIQLDLLQPERAISHVEDVLRERPNDYEGRELAERMLEIGSLRGRAARMLEFVYETRNETRDLVRVLSIRLEVLGRPAEEETEEDAQTRRDERRELLRRVAILRDERLHDDQGALAALSELVPSDPLDEDARERLLEIGRRVGAHAEVASVLAQAASGANTTGLKGEILMQVARIYEDALGDAERAETHYKGVLQLDPEDIELVLPAARALERLYQSASRHAEVAEMLRVQVKLEPDGDKRRDLLGRLGELCQSVIHDNEGAIVAWRTRLDDNPGDHTALSALDRLYEGAESWRELVDILERRRDITEQPDARRALMTRSAETLWHRLAAIPAAIDAYQALLDQFGPDESSLGSLESLYTSAERWDELAETLERHLEIAQSSESQLSILVRLGDLRREHLADLDGALEAYRRALDLDSGHAASRAALERLLEADQNAARREAAQVLHPIYEADGDHERLLKVLEIEIATSEDPLERLERYKAAIEVAETKQEDSARAFGYAARAARDAAGHTELLPWLVHLERLAAATDRQREYVQLLCEVASEIFDGEVQLSVTLKIADLARHQLADRELARDYYKKTLELRVDEPRALAALESLYEEAGDAQNLLEVLSRRVDVAESDEDRKTLLFRRARLLSEAIGDNERAIEAYESILDIGLDPNAIQALEKLYAAEGQWMDLVQLYQRQLDARIGDPAALRVCIAEVAATKQNDPTRAFDELEQALDLERQHPGAVAELERLLEQSPEAEHRARAASLLEPVYLLSADYTKVMAAVRARLEFAAGPDERRELLTRLAQLYEEQQEDYLSALETIAKLLPEDLSDESVVTELERLAKVAGAEARLAEIYGAELDKVEGDDASSARLSRRTGELFQKLGEADKALIYLRRALSYEPESRELFDAVDVILSQTGRHEERVELYRAALEHRFEPEERISSLHSMATLQRGELSLPDQAIETYRGILEIDEQDRRALDALTELFRQRERWEDLAEIYLSRAEAASSPARQGEFRLALARLYKTELADPERALEQLDEVVTGSPDSVEAIAELESLRSDESLRERVVEILRPLYETSDDWRRLIQLNEDRFELSETPAEKAQVLRETAQLWETRGKSQGRARRALAAAVKLDPDDADVRAEYERLVEQTGAWEGLAETYEEVLAAHPDLLSAREVLSVLARVHNVHRDDPRRALDAYDRLRASDETDIEPLNKMEQLATLLSDWDVLVRVLTVKAELLLDDEERASVWRRVAEAKRDMLENPRGAIDAYERALELEPDSAFSVDCLIDLYEKTENAERLVELYERRVELSDEDDGELKYNLLVLAAECYENKLGNRAAAIESLRQALAVMPGDANVVSGLNRLYRAEEMWSDLLDNLRLQADAAGSVEERAVVQKEIGSVLSGKLQDFDDALEAFRAVLDALPNDSETISAVRELARDHDDLRSRVAEILVPVLGRTEHYEELVDVLEMRLSVEASPDERGLTLRAIAETLERRLGRAEGALDALLRAFGETPEAEDLHADIERLASTLGAYERYADALNERAQSTFEPDLARDLYVRLGQIAETKLRKFDRAVDAYVHAAEQSGDQPVLLAALDRLYSELGEHDKLAEVLERRVVTEDSESDQAELYYRLALLQIERFSEPARGLSSLRMALERNQEHERAAAELEKLTGQRDLFEEAAEVLEEVYRARGRTDSLASLYEKRVGFAETPGERIDMRRSLARVLEEDCSDPAAAQRVLQQGFGDDPSDEEVLSEVGRLAELTHNWEAAALALCQAIDKRPELSPDTASELYVRAALWLRDKVGDPRAAEETLTKALELVPDNDEVLVALEELQRAPGRELELIETLRRRAKLVLGDEERAELYRRAKELADSLANAELSEAILRELLKQDDTNLWALGELTTLRERAGDYRETFELLVQRSELRAVGDVVRTLRRNAAGIARDQLREPDKAIELYQHLFEDDPTDADAAAALRSLYEENQRVSDLMQLLERLVDLADRPSERSALRRKLSELHKAEGAADSAIEVLRQVLEDDPSESEAVVALSELYEETGRDEELAELLSEQIQAAAERNDHDAELRFQVRLGEIYESRLGDRERAIAAYQHVLERDPRQRDALLALSRLFVAEGKHDQAAATLEQLLDRSEGADAVRLAVELAEVQDKLKNPEGAARALERGLSADPNEPSLRARLRELYRSMKNWDRLAELIAGDAERASGDDQVKLLREAATLHSEKRNDPAAAAELLGRASELKPDDRNLMLELCDAYSASGRGKAAAEVLERIVESYAGRRSKELGEIHRRLANAYLAEGDNVRALGELDKAFRIEPGNVNVLKKLGDVALETGDFKKAQQMFRALLLQKLEGDSPITKAEVFMRLGQVHEELGEKPKAIQMYERAVQSDAALEEAKQRLASLKG